MKRLYGQKLQLLIKPQADLDDYGTKRTSKKTVKSNYDAVKNVYDESLKNNGWCEETYEAADNLRVAQDKMNAADDALSGTKIQQSKNAKAKVKKDISDAQDSLNEANKALKTETKAAKKAGKKAGLKGDELNTSITNTTKAQQQAVSDATKAVAYAKAKTPFGKLTTKAGNKVHNSQTYKYLTADETTSVIKNIKNIKVSDVAKNLGKDGMAIFKYLQDGNKTYQAFKEFGYDNTMQVLKTLYAYNQTNQMI